MSDLGALRCTAGKKKADTTTTERKSFRERFWPQRKTVQAGGGYKSPIKTRKAISTAEIFPLWTHFFSLQRKLLHWSRAVYGPFFPGTEVCALQARFCRNGCNPLHLACWQGSDSLASALLDLSKACGAVNVRGRHLCLAPVPSPGRERVENNSPNIRFLGGIFLGHPGPRRRDIPDKNFMQVAFFLLF